MKLQSALLITSLLASPLAAHPHIFIDTGFELRFDANGELAEVKVTWFYDEFYTLLIMEDRGLDPDFDGVLTQAEQEDLEGFDMQWSEGFSGDLVIEQAGQALTLSGPSQATALYQDGRITTTHVRQVSGAEKDRGEIAVKPYDETYYSAYDITLPIRIEGADHCNHLVEVPDLNVRLQELQGLLASLDTMTAPDEAGLPNIGEQLSSQVLIRCDIS